MKPLYIAFLWHQHQPYYKDNFLREYIMPWVRLHGTKDYYDMVAILDEFPKIRQTFNFTPSLLLQIEDYSKGAVDKHLKLTLKPTEELSNEEKIFVLKNFFMASPQTMIEPYPAYNELFLKRGRFISDEYISRVVSYFTTQELRDIIVWFNLTWVDPYFRSRDHFIRFLFEKGKDFSEEEKKTLITKTKEIISLIIPKHKELQDKGQIELTTTPFYHPILPLLINTEIAKISTPQIVLPKVQFKHSEDAEAQINKAVSYYEKIFGRKPRGFWPSEGSVSEDIVPLMANAGVKWLATDEEILLKTLAQAKPRTELIYKPYRVKIGDASLDIIFRDRELSDLIGFSYTRVFANDAVNHFIGKLKSIQASVEAMPGEHIVNVILDGENCWEYYYNDGHDFLKLLYTKISEDETLITTTVSDFLAKFPPKDELNKLWPGSWINANYGIWIGHSEDNLAWEYLKKTRDFLVNFSNEHMEYDHKLGIEKAWEEIYIAEGSDWCWWYGDDHSSAHDEEFDFLFRKHLMNVYTFLGQKPPDYLYIAIKRRGKIGEILDPVNFIKPRIDGKVTSYFEWHNAGLFEAEKSGGTMHRSDTILKRTYWGFDMDNLYFRLDIKEEFKTPSDRSPTVGSLMKFKITFLSPEKKSIIFEITSGESPDKNKESCAIFDDSNKIKELNFAHEKVVELVASFSDLSIQLGSIFEFVIIVEENGIEIERWPYNSSISYTRNPDEFQANHWSV